VDNALYGSFLPIPSSNLFPPTTPATHLPGEVICLKDKIQLNPSRKRVYVQVSNHGDRPIQVGSHYPFLEVNAHLHLDRGLAYGKHLDIAAGTAVRFEPGETKTVPLVEIGGQKLLKGGSGLGDGAYDESSSEAIANKAKEKGFGHVKQEDIKSAPIPSMDREVVSGPPDPAEAVRIDVWTDNRRQSQTRGYGLVGGN